MTKKHILCTLALVLAVTASGMGIAWIQASTTERIWSDGFEGGEALTAKYEDVSTLGLSVTTADAFTGAHALEQHYDQGQVDAGWVCKVNNEGFPDHIFVRWYHKFEEGFEGFPPKMARVRYRPRYGEWASVFAVNFWIEEDGEVVADVYAQNSSQANSAGWLPIARSGFFLDAPENAGRWIRFEMEVKLNTPGQADGLYRFWANDEMIIEQTGVDLRGTTQDKINEIMLDCYWNGGSPKAQSRYYDDFVIATERVGPDAPSGVLHLLGDPADHAIHLSWEVSATLPTTSTWRIAHINQFTPTPVTIGPVISTTRAYELEGLTNGVLYTVTLNAMLDATPILTDTVSVMPHDPSAVTFLPLVSKGRIGGAGAIALTIAGLMASLALFALRRR